MKPANIMHSETETMRIDIPHNSNSDLVFHAFIDPGCQNGITSLTIVQQYYDGYKQTRATFAVVLIPHTITNLTDQESISIRALIYSLPNSLSSLKKLELLDLSGCYNILSIPSEVLAMSNLNIKKFLTLMVYAERKELEASA